MSFLKSMLLFVICKKCVTNLSGHADPLLFLFPDSSNFMILTSFFSLVIELLCLEKLGIAFIKVGN